MKSVVAQEPQPSDQVQQRLEQMRRQFEQQQQEELARLKSTNPELYAKRRAAIERQERIRTTLSALHEGALTETQAEQRLAPIVKQDLQETIDGLDGQIQRLEQRLAFLRAAKKDPDLLVTQRIERLLGKTTLRPDELIW